MLMMGTSHHLHQTMSLLKNLGKCTKVHAHLGPGVDGCQIFDGGNPRSCGACGCHMNFHKKLNLDSSDVILEPKHKIFLSHSGAQKDFVEQLCVDLERCDRYPFFDKHEDSLPIGENFPQHIFDAIQQCHVGVVILSDEFFTRSKWPMMELAAMMKEVEKKKSNFKIMPVFLHISLSEFRDPMKRNQWLSLWNEWSLRNKRIVVEEWVLALKYILSLNSLVYDGLGEVRFRENIVNTICRVVPPETRLEDSHIQGKSRLCKVIQDKIVDMQQNYEVNGACIVGLYGMAGIGKTSICKVLCNEYFMEFNGRVCHVELERMSKEKLMREVVKRLTNTNLELLNGMNFDELLNRLKHGIVKEPVFLALDNMSDTDVSIREVEYYLSQSFLLGSIVMVTARSLGTLVRMKPYVDESNCVEMPELGVEEAKSLFTESSKFELGHEVNEQLIMRCVKKCCFRKGNGKQGYHYHPLALDVLGRQLRGIAPEECKALLDKINEDIFNYSGENNHPIFSILRASFDSLSAEDQLLFMDVALYLPVKVYKKGYEGFNVLKWLGMVHGIASATDVMRRLERLKRRSLLESSGDGIRTRLSIHDLWLAFCVAETGNGELGCRRWVYLKKKRDKLLETTPNFGIWQNVKRMAIDLDFNSELTSLKRVAFTYFPNVTVLTLWGQKSEQLVLDLSGLIHLMSLEVRGECLRRLILQGLPRDLIFLSIISMDLDILNVDSYVPRFNKPALKMCNISNLRVLQLHQCEFKDLSGLITLRALERFTMKGGKKLQRLPTLRGWRTVQETLRGARAGWCKIIQTLNLFGSAGGTSIGVSACLTRLECRTIPLWELPDLSYFPHLKNLKLENCEGLRRLTSHEPINAMLELKLFSCSSLTILPDLCCFPRLLKLEIETCHGLATLKCSNPMTALKKLWIRSCTGITTLPNLGMFPALLILDLHGCRGLTVLSSSATLGALSQLDLQDCSSLIALPELGMFPALSLLDLHGCSRLKELNISVPSTALLVLNLQGFIGVKALPNLKMFPALKNLGLYRCNGLTALSSTVPLTALQWLHLQDCPGLEALPDLGMVFPRLKGLFLYRCNGLRVLSSSVPLTALLQLNLLGCDLQALPSLEMFPALLLLDLYECSGLTALSMRVPSTALLDLKIQGCNGMKELPNLEMFPALSLLNLYGCCGLTTLSSNVPLTALSQLIVRGCSELTAVPDLRMFPTLSLFDIHGCSQLRFLSNSAPLTALSQLNIQDCSSLETMPDLGMFPALPLLDIHGCNWLKALSSSVPSTALLVLNLQGCSNVESLPDLEMFPALENLELYGCSRLTAVSSTVSSTALQRLHLQDCTSLTALPDLGMFPALSVLDLRGCSRLTALRSSVPLTALHQLDVRGCSSLSWDAVGQIRAWCPGVKKGDENNYAATNIDSYVSEEDLDETNIDSYVSEEDLEEHRRARRGTVGLISDVESISSNPASWVPRSCDMPNSSVCDSTY